MSQLKKWIKTEEGFSEKVYTCIQGVPTIGYGFTSLSEDEADVILDIKINKLRFKVEAFLIAQKINLDSFRKDVPVSTKFFILLRQGDHDLCRSRRNCRPPFY